MCLEVVTKSRPEPGDLQREGTAYKVYQKIDGRWYPPYCNKHAGSNALPVGTMTKYDPIYTLGYHCFETLESARSAASWWGLEDHGVFAVKWKGLLSRDSEHQGAVVVVKEILSKRKVRAK